jgi:hypothetical protein
MKLYRYRKHPADALVDDSQTLHRWKTSEGQLPLVDDKHGAELDHGAAEFEFINHFARDKAEQEVYGKYAGPHHREAAIHHYRGMLAANGSGDLDEAALHSAAYRLHMAKLKEDPEGHTVPDWITEGMKPGVKKSMGDLPQWAQVNLLKIAIQNLSKADEEAKPIACPKCNGSGSNRETNEDCQQCEGWGTILDWQVSPDPPPAEPVKDSDFVTPKYSKLPEPEPPNFNDVDQLRMYYGEKISPDFDPRSAAHFGKLIASLDPDERQHLEYNLFEHDRWRNRQNPKLPPATGPSLAQKSEVLHRWFEALGRPVIEEAAELLKKDYIKLTLLKASVIPFPTDRAKATVVPEAERAGEVVPLRPQRADTAMMYHDKFRGMDDQTLIDLLNHYEQHPEDDLKIPDSPYHESHIARHAYNNRPKPSSTKSKLELVSSMNQAGMINEKPSFLQRLKAKFTKPTEKKEKEPEEGQEDRRKRDTNSFKGKPHRQEDKSWAVVPEEYEPVKMKSEKKPKPYMGRKPLDRERAPGQPGANKHGAGVQKDKKKEENKNAAREWKDE